MEGRAVCHGAATIVNGIATGMGASFGIGLRTEARVELTDDPADFSVEIENDPAEDPALAVLCVREVLSRSGCEGVHGASVRTRSDIPISRGLKSSSTAANAIVLATCSALGIEMGDMEVIRAGIEASFKAKVTITGAFDDACAAYFGGVVVTDNRHMEVLRRYDLDEDLVVIVHVPPSKIRKMSIETSHLAGISPAVRAAHDLALEGEHASALMINGLAYGSAMGLDLSPTMAALRNGALTAGITGTGPATVALCDEATADAIVSSLPDGTVIRTRPSSVKASILRP